MAAKPTRRDAAAPGRKRRRSVPTRGASSRLGRRPISLPTAEEVCVRLLVTRPEADAVRTAAALRARGHDVLAAALLRIETDPDAVLGTGPWAAVLIASANAVRAIAAHPRRREIGAVPVFAVGRRTAAAA